MLHHLFFRLCWYQHIDNLLENKFTESITGELVTSIIDIFLTTQEHTVSLVIITFINPPHNLCLKAIQMEAIWVLGYLVMICYMTAIGRRNQSFLTVKNHAIALQRLGELLTSSSDRCVVEQIPWLFHKILSFTPNMGLTQSLVWKGGIRVLFAYAEVIKFHYASAFGIIHDAGILDPRSHCIHAYYFDANLLCTDQYHRLDRPS